MDKNMPNYSSFESRYAAIPAGRIHYLVHNGPGKRLLLVHGLAATTRSWMRLVEHLPDSMHICIVDLLGHGESESPRVEYTVALQMAAIEAVVKAEALADFYILGHSYGGWIAAVYAASHKNIEGLVIEDSNGLAAFFEEIRGSLEREEYKKGLVMKAMELGAKEYVTRSILADEFSEHMLEAEDLARIRAPTLILWGEKDAVIDPKYGRLFNRYIGGSTLKVIKGAKHTPHYTNSREVARCLLGFIEST